MKPINKLRLKIFLLMGLTFGLTLAFMDFRRGEEFSIVDFIAHVVLFGFGMAYALTLTLKKRLNASLKTLVTIYINLTI